MGWHRFLIAFGGLAAVAVLLLPSAAAPLSGPTDRVHQDLVMQPHSGPNGDYAVMNDQDELELNFGPSNPNVTDGINPDSVTVFDEVFTIRYTGDQSAVVWLRSDVAGLSFYRGADATDSIEGRANNVTLGPGQTLEVGVLIDTTDGWAPRGDSFTLNARLAVTTDQDGIERTDNAEPTDNVDSGIQQQDDDSDGGDWTRTPTPEETSSGAGDDTTETDSDGAGATNIESGAEVTSTTVVPDTATPDESLTLDATAETEPTPDETQTTVAPVTSAGLADEPSPTPSESGGFPWLIVWLGMLLVAVTVTGYWTVQYAGS